MFCVECGKEEVYKNGVCFSCYLKNKQFTKGPDVLDLYQCPKCLSFKYKNTWLQESFADSLKRHIKDIFTISKELKKVHIASQCEDQIKQISCMILISGFVEDREVIEEHFLTVRVKKITCDICSKQYGGYYEATLQIRTQDKKPTKQDLETIKETVESLVETFRDKGNRGLFITDIAINRGGLDFYLSEKGLAHTIAKKIQETYGGEIKQSAKNVGMKDSKQVYRMTYLVRVPSYKTGDFISIHSRFFRISSLHGTKIHVIDLFTWEESVIEEKELKNVKIIGGKERIKDMILVSQTKDEVQVMDPQSYKMYELPKPEPFFYKAKEILVVILNNDLFLLPEK
jgi:nonsense-mediated mRNA decay protein 3